MGFLLFFCLSEGSQCPVMKIFGDSLFCESTILSAELHWHDETMVSKDDPETKKAAVARISPLKTE